MDSEEIMQRLAGSKENDIYSFPLAKKFDNELKYREVTEYEDKVTLSKADYFKRIPAVAFLTIENKRLEGRLTGFSVKRTGRSTFLFRRRPESLSILRYRRMPTECLKMKSCNRVLSFYTARNQIWAVI